MANVEFRYAPGQTVPHLDVSAMISALRLQPGDFEYTQGSLHHVPSRHRFQFDRFGRVAIDAACGCATMTIKPEQTDELVGMFKTWRRDYWIPLETNREFAAHFSKPNALGPAYARAPDGLSALRAPRESRHNWRHDGTDAVGDARGIGLAVSTLSSAVLLLTLRGAARDWPLVLLLTFREQRGPRRLTRSTERDGQKRRGCELG